SKLAGTPTTTSHAPAFKVLRMKPRRCAHQVYSSFSCRSSANSSAILFSNPSPRSFENGRLFGSAHTRRTPGGRCICACADGFGCTLPAHERASETNASRSHAKTTRTRSRVECGFDLGKREDIE